MRILAFDTSLQACSAAVLSAAGPVAALCEPMERGHAERLLPMIAEVMARAGLGFAELDRIAVTVGPGTFTGVRVGIAAAQGLRLATGHAVVGATSLQAMAAGLGDDWLGHTIAAVADARKDQLYVQVFAGSALAPLTMPQLLDASEAARQAEAGRPVVAIGTGTAAFLAAAARIGLEAVAGPAKPYPEARHLAELAPHLGVLDPVRPLYLRPPDAKPQASTLQSKARMP